MKRKARLAKDKHIEEEETVDQNVLFCDLMTGLADVLAYKQGEKALRGSEKVNGEWIDASHKDKPADGHK